jgi:hypothetical protein
MLGSENENLFKNLSVALVNVSFGSRNMYRATSSLTDGWLSRHPRGEKQLARAEKRRRNDSQEVCDEARDGKDRR